MKQQTKLLGIIVILIALLAGAFVLYQNLSKKYKADTASKETSSGDATEKQEAVTAPDFNAENADGKSINFFSLTGKKPIVLNFWASWCPPCKQEMPGFEAMYKKYSDKVNFAMVNICLLYTSLHPLDFQVHTHLRPLTLKGTECPLL